MSRKSASSTAQHSKAYMHRRLQTAQQTSNSMSKRMYKQHACKVYTQHTCIDHAMSTHKGACQQHICGGLCRQSTCKGHHSQRHTPYMQDHHSQRHTPYMQGHMQTVYMQGHMQTACSIHTYMQALTGRGGANAPGLSAIPVQ